MAKPFPNLQRSKCTLVTPCCFLLWYFSINMSAGCCSFRSPCWFIQPVIMTPIFLLSRHGFLYGARWACNQGLFEPPVNMARIVLSLKGLNVWIMTYWGWKCLPWGKFSQGFPRYTIVQKASLFVSHAPLGSRWICVITIIICDKLLQMC